MARLCIVAQLAVAWTSAALGTAGAAPVDVSSVPFRPSPSTLPEGWHHGAFMEVFVRAFADSNGDGIGDLKGLTQRLDYLQALGIKGLWLMPVTPSADGDHGYATTEFRAIEPAYGTLDDFDELLRQAHARGIGVVMDYVLNHAAAEHPLFRAARQSRRSPWRDWFVWSDEPPLGWDIWGKYPWYPLAAQPTSFQGKPIVFDKAPPPGARELYFGTFGPHMPDFNHRNPKVVDYHLSSLRFWLNRGLDGFRLDAVPHLIENNPRDWNDQPESRALTARFVREIHRYPNRFVVCEATAEPQAYGDPALCGGAFAFGYAHHFVQAAKGDAASVAELARYYTKARPTMATFLSSHDIFAGRRLWDQVGGDEARYRLAAAGYLLQPGTPFIYYGEEVGQASLADGPGDVPVRAPMSWSATAPNGGFSAGRPFRPPAPNLATHNAHTEASDPGSILAFYRAMLALRNSLPSIARGRFEHGFADDLVLGFQRALGDERTLVLINYAEAPRAMTLRDLGAGRVWTAHHPVDAPPLRADAEGGAAIELPAQSVRVYRQAR